MIQMNDDKSCKILDLLFVNGASLALNCGQNPVLCRLRTRQFAIRVFRCRNPSLDKELLHKGIEVYGRPGGVRHQEG